MATAARFCEWLTSKATSAGSPHVYRLPTEPEWEYICRGGNAGAFCYGGQESHLRYFIADVSPLHAVATAMPNAYGVFDMHGSLWEICSSPYRRSYDDPPVANDLADVVMRGGALYSKPRACRCADAAD